MANEVWDSASASLLAVVDLEERGVADRHFDFRDLRGMVSPTPEPVLAVMDAYERRSGQRLAIERIMGGNAPPGLQQ